MSNGETQFKGSEVLRTTFCMEGVLGGTKLFLLFDEGRARPFTVTTRFQTWGSFKSLEKAVERFEKVSFGEVRMRDLSQ